MEALGSIVHIYFLVFVQAKGGMKSEEPNEPGERGTIDESE